MRKITAVTGQRAYSGGRLKASCGLDQATTAWGQPPPAVRSSAAQQVLAWPE